MFGDEGDKSVKKTEKKQCDRSRTKRINSFKHTKTELLRRSKKMLKFLSNPKAGFGII